MRVVIAGAGSVGRSIAHELLGHDHEVLLVDRNPLAMRVAQVPDADWVLADACELSSLHDADVETADVVVGATGDDKVNLVFSLLCKTEFGVPRTVARVNHPKNEWMFDGSWGVDVAVSTPRIMTAMVEEAVAVGELVSILSLQQSGADVLELTLPPDSPLSGTRVGRIDWPDDTALSVIVRDGHPIVPTADDTLEAHDEILIVSGADADRAALRRLLTGVAMPGPSEATDARPTPDVAGPDGPADGPTPDMAVPDGSSGGPTTGLARHDHPGQEEDQGPQGHSQ